MISRRTQTISYEYKANRDDPVSKAPCHTSPGFQAPTIDVQLANLTPSKHLVDYYRKKILQYDEEDNRIKGKLKEYMKISDQRHNLQQEVLRLMEKIKALQNGLDEMQNCLLHEREHVVKLYEENDKLKLRILEDHERILELLAMTGNADLHDKIVYIFNEPPINISIFERKTVPENRKQTKVKEVAAAKKQSFGTKTSIQQDNSTPSTILKSQVDTLQLQLQDQKRICKQQLETMAENYGIQLEEGKVQSLVDKQMIQSLSDRLKRTEELLQLSTLDFLELKKNVRKKEIRWAAEKDALIRNLHTAVQNAVESTEVKTLVKEVTDAIKAADELMKASSRMDILGYISEKEELQNAAAQITCRDPMKTDSERHITTQSNGELNDYTDARARTHFVELKVLQEELSDIRKLSKSYRNQCLKMEEHLNDLREEHEANLASQKKKNAILVQRLHSTRDQQKRLETYRKLEIEGFKTDIKNLKQKIKEMEKQLLKAIMLFEQGEKDMELLKTVHRSALRTKHVTDEIKRLKAKLYQLESEIRNL